MRLTNEQIQIINSTGNIKINAVAGSGKTTTLIEYARTRPRESKILYLAFNRSVKLEAMQKFAARGLHNVQVETAHSLAYKHIVPKNGYAVRAQGYKTTEIADMLRLPAQGQKHDQFILANHINRFLSYYCNSAKASPADLNYLEPLSDNKAKGFVNNAYKFIEKKVGLLLDQMNEGKIDITHDFYLKKFQLSDPKLHYDYILFDEGQDASPAMLDIFLKQSATKVIVGDTHQQIYSWRYAVNSLEKTDFSSHGLTTSFRFGEGIAGLATETLKLKKYVGREEGTVLIGAGGAKEIKTRALIGRTNLQLLLRAIEMVTAEKPLQSLYFEGNFNSYTYAEDGTSLYDVLNLYNGKHHLIRDKLIRSMRYLHELEDYVKKTEDMQLGMMIEIVKVYGNDIPHILKMIKERHVSNEEKHKAEMIFSTVHRCKGMEYDEVHLLHDFITEDKLKKVMDGKTEKLTPAKANEEINLLYVAITRARVRLHIPETFVPKEFPAFPGIEVVKCLVEEQVPESIAPQTKKEKGYAVAEKRKECKYSYAGWSEEADHELKLLLKEGMSSREMAKHFGRTAGAIESRIRKLQL